MPPTRRKLLAVGGAGLLAGLAGCSTRSDRSEGEPGDGAGDAGQPVDAAVAAEWNAMRARLWDALGLGLAGETDAGAAVAEQTFARFEAADGEYGAHEMLESTNEEGYAEFEEALSELRTAGLEPGDLGRAREEATIADTQLAETQRALVGEETAALLELQLLGTTVLDAGALAAAGAFEAAGTTAADALERFEAADVHDAVEAADGEAYEAFENAAEATVAAAGDEDADAVRENAAAAFDAALDGSYALAESTAVAGAGHLAALQARGWDAAALASMGGPSTAFAHAAALTVYRVRVADARWLAAGGEPDRAATVVSDTFAHFEGARAHEALEEADGEAYEGFEAGLSSLGSAIENGDTAAVEEALAAVDSNLVAGIEALAGGRAPLLAASFFRARFADARERYRLGEPSVAASVAEGLFERFEADELGLHESMESTSETLYSRFEEEHLSGLIQAFENGDDEAVATHYEGVQSALLEFETAAGATAAVSGAEAAYMAARGFDAAVLDRPGEDDRAEAIARAAFEHFEAGAGGYHEALEEADSSVYESFEQRLGAVATAADEDDDVYPAATAFNEEAVASMYAVVGNAGGSQTTAAATVVGDVFAHFEGARVHDALETADHNAYETFEEELDAYVTALEEGGEVTDAAASFAHAAQYAAFALLDSVERLPLDLNLAGGSGGGGSGESEGESALQGGPNVVEGVPDDADHVVDMTAVAFEPSSLTVAQGDTVAWRFAAGEPHSVSAYGDGIPEGATYWASGGFDSEEAARTGWENGKGAVGAGQSYVHTFETTGTHEYFCIPHEQAGMVGEVVVE